MRRRAPSPRHRAAQLALVGVLVALFGHGASPAAAHGDPRWAVSGLSSLSVRPSAADLTSTVWSTSLGGAHTFASGARVRLDLGFSWMALDAAGQADASGFDMANVLLGGGYVFTPAPPVTLRADLRVGAPLATFPGGIAENRRVEHAHLVSLNAQGLSNPWLWTPNVIPLVLDAEAEVALGPATRLVASLSPAALVSVNVRPSRVALLTRATLAQDLGPVTIGAGLRWYLSGLALENDELDQIAAEGRVGVRIGAHRVDAGVTVNLDRPWGVVDEAPRPDWALQLGLALAFGAETASVAQR